MFQSTHPRRVWHWSVSNPYTQGRFNPHTHAGCDCRYLRRYPFWQCFNPHTHAGCDYSNRINFIIKTGFNPHTHAGCDFILISLVTLSGSFNPHTHAGCDTNQTSIDINREFQSTHPRRVWRYSGFRVYSNLHVSIHTPTQGVTLYLITYYKSANLIHCYANHHYYSTS